MAIAQLTIEIEARLARLEEGLDRAARINAKAAKDVTDRWNAATAAVKKFLIPFAAAGLAANWVKNFVVENARAVDSLNDIADATGAAVNKIAALQDIAVRTGSPIESVETALVKLNQALNAAKPNSDVERALNAIGLTAKQLRDLDPADALRKVAVALAGYANDGNKARLVQELLGRSARELAPLLKDLAERQGELTSKIGPEETRKAEEFTHALGAFELQAKRTGQAIAVSLLPPLTKLLEAWNQGGFGQAGGALLGLTQIDREFNALKNAQRALEDANLAFAAGADKGLPENRMLELETAVVNADAAVNRLRQSFQKLNAEGKAGGGRGFVNPEFTRGSVGDLTAPGKPSAEELARKFKRFDAAQDAFVRSELEGQAETNKALADINLAKLVADQLFQAEVALKRFDDVHDAFRRSELEATEDVNKAMAELKTKTAELSEFALQAQRNIQDALGDTVLATLEGRFESIGKLWGDLLRRMVAQAIAARIGESLFGVNNVGGIFAPLLKAIGFRAGGGPVSPGMPYIVGEKGPELFVPRQAGTVIANGRQQASVVIHDNRTVNVGDIATASQVSRAIASSNAYLEAKILRSKSRGGVYA